MFRANKLKNTAEEREFDVWLDKTEHHLEWNTSLDLPFAKMFSVYATRFKIIRNRQDRWWSGFEIREFIKFLDSNEWI